MKTQEYDARGDCVIVTLYNGDFSYYGPMKDLIARLQERLDEAPGEYHDALQCELDAVPGWEGAADATLRVWYTRPETNAEKMAKERAIRTRQEKEIADARAVLAKYGEE